MRAGGWKLQLTLILVAGALWSLWPHASWGALLAGYAASWLCAQALLRLRPRLFSSELRSSQAFALCVLLGVPPAVKLASLTERLLENESLDALSHHVTSRRRLEALPAIHPPLVATDRPQTFYVFAPEAQTLDVRWGEGTALSTTSLGAGLFRLEYDPRRDGPPSETVTIIADGEPHRRSAEMVTPLAHPRWLRPSPSRRAVATVSEETDELYIFDEDGLRTQVEVGDGPVDVAWMDEGRLLIAHRFEPRLWLLRDGRPSEHVDVGPFMRAMAMAPSASEEGAPESATSRPAVAVARGGREPGLQLYTDQLELHSSLALPAVPDWVIFGPSPDQLVVATRSDASLHRYAYDGERWTEDAPPLLLGRPAVTLARAAEGAEALVAVTDLRPEGPAHLGNHFIQDQLLTVDVVRWRVRAERRTALRTARQRGPGDVDRGVSPMGIDAASDGSVWVAFAGTDDVWRFTDSAPGELYTLDGLPLAAPFSVVAQAGGGFWVSSPSQGAVGRFDASGELRHLVRLAPDDDALLQTNEQALQHRIGERGFWESTRAGVSCQSCHLHGSSDLALHNIGGQSLVGTLDVRGLAGTPPFLRDGGYPLLGSLDDLAQTLYRGYLRAQGGRRFALDRYLRSLPRPPPYGQLEERDLDAERRGRRVFVDAGCELCHTPPAFTNLGQHPTATLFPRIAAAHPETDLDTPSLLGLEHSAPYLVDGRASTLSSIFRRHNPAGRHGHTAPLSDAQLSDLIAFIGGL